MGLGFGVEVFALQAVGEGQVPGAVALPFGFALVSGADLGVAQRQLGGGDGRDMRWRCSSSRVSAWVCAPGTLGTIPI